MLPWLFFLDFLQILLPLCPGSITLLPLAGFRARVCWGEEVISLPSQPPFAVSIRKNGRTLIFQQLRYLLKSQFRRIVKVHCHGLYLCQRSMMITLCAFWSERDFVHPWTTLVLIWNILPKAGSLPVLRGRLLLCSEYLLPESRTSQGFPPHTSQR